MSRRGVAGPDLAPLLAQLLGEGHAVRFRVRGASMAPAIRDGDVILAEPLGERPPLPGDVLVYQSAERKILVHRVVRVASGVAGGRLISQGDGLEAPDPPFDICQVLGRVVEVRRHGRTVPFHRRAPRLCLQRLAFKTQQWLRHGMRILHPHLKSGHQAFVQKE